VSLAAMRIIFKSLQSISTPTNANKADRVAAEK